MQDYTHYVYMYSKIGSDLVPFHFCPQQAAARKLIEQRPVLVPALRAQCGCQGTLTILCVLQLPRSTNPTMVSLFSPQPRKSAALLPASTPLCYRRGHLSSSSAHGHSRGLPGAQALHTRFRACWLTGGSRF